jgi:MoxR-like ATPase
MSLLTAGKDKNRLSDPSGNASESAARALVETLRERLNSVLMGKRGQIELVLACLFARGHLLLDDLPGTGKTTLAKTLAEGLGGRFGRLQCTPDLLPTDITGFNLFNQKTREFEFHPGPVFSDVLLADEINRTTPRTQSALLEAMAERQVTIDAAPHPLVDTFFVIATQNPIDSHGAYPLPEAQLDRFAMRLEIGYPDREAQMAMLAATPREFVVAEEGEEVAAKLSIDELRDLQRRVAAVSVHTAVQGYLIDLVEATRKHESIELGVSPRGMLSWQRVAQAWAFLKGRDFVTPQDIQEVATPVLSVRLVVRSGSSASVIKSLLSETPVPDYRS